MAARTIGAEGAVVSIVQAMAGDAVLAQGRPPIDRAAMTREAVQSRVPAVQGESGLRVVVEAPGRPGVRVVAGLAAWPERATMGIVLGVARDAARVGPGIAAADVAFLASDRRVEAQQGETGQIVVEANSLAPSHLSMALPACRPLAAPVHVVACMAARAVGPEALLVQRAGVAGGAGELAMGAAKREPGLACMVEGRRLPGHRGVALLAAIAVASPVRVVGAMAREAVAGELRGPDAPHVAGLARHARVASRERKAGLARVVEADLLPGDRRVAALAARAEASVMDVVHGVAADAVPRRPGVALARMADCAGNLGVLAVQRESRLRVVETGSTPRPLRVAGSAIGPHRTVVRVLARVARAAGRRCLAPRLSARVTAAARDLRVSTRERKIGERVAEGFALEAHDVGVAPLVLGVTGPASGARGARRLPVEAEVAGLILGHVLVAGTTQIVLLLGMQRGVTLRAVALELRMRGRDRTRHHQPLERAGVALPAARQQGQRDSDAEDDGAAAHSVDVDGDHVDGRRGEEQDAEREVDGVPEAEETLPERELRHSAHRSEVLSHQRKDGLGAKGVEGETARWSSRRSGLEDEGATSRAIRRALALVFPDFLALIFVMQFQMLRQSGIFVNS